MPDLVRLYYSLTYGELHTNKETRYQRLPVLHLHRQDLLVGRQARRFRSGRRGS